MKNKIELEQRIANIISTIRRDFPELTKYFVETPSMNSGDDETNIKNLQDYYNSLKELVNNNPQIPSNEDASKLQEKSEFPGYPHYPPSEDIYLKDKKEGKINPADLSKNKTPNEDNDSMNEKGFQDDMSGSDLDVPGSELDDQQESVGSEDEENNYYSLGGDGHSDLEEN